MREGRLRAAFLFLFVSDRRVGSSPIVGAARAATAIPRLRRICGFAVAACAAPTGASAVSRLPELASRHHRALPVRADPK
ncbi:hypothetical protein GLE_3635 [Lysobacter enzymogenes]|uniref:Uncharacterized protein n=1 Tax=Lysobacter enzymogenes TaxID=69 RepID=A0A0S2DKE6_LYSEN|nr:hypothetical protein GLE_3635 [Lysobacter enzymogenes]